MKADWKNAFKVRCGYKLDFLTFLFTVTSAFLLGLIVAIAIMII